MSPEAVRAVLDRYARELDCPACAPGLGGAMAVGALDPDDVPPHRCRLYYRAGPSYMEVPVEANPAQREHVLTMLPRMRVFIEQGRIEKTMRWLGFVQGWLWAIGRYSVEELADHNREASERFPDLPTEARTLLRRLGELLPTMLETLPWGAFKSALLQDGSIKAAVASAAKEAADRLERLRRR